MLPLYEPWSQHVALLRSVAGIQKLSLGHALGPCLRVRAFVSESGERFFARSTRWRWVASSSPWPWPVPSSASSAPWAGTPRNRGSAELLSLRCVSGYKQPLSDAESPYGFLDDIRRGRLGRLSALFSAPLYVCTTHPVSYANTANTHSYISTGNDRDPPPAYMFWGCSLRRATLRDYVCLPWLSGKRTWKKQRPSRGATWAVILKFCSSFLTEVTSLEALWFATRHRLFSVTVASI